MEQAVAVCENCEARAPFEGIEKLSKDLKRAAQDLTHDEIRYLVDAYYQIQKTRISSGNRIFALSNNKEPHEVFGWYQDNAERLERYLKKVLDYYTDYSAIGRWSKGIYGIGPVIAAGLEAHIDIERCPHVSALWAYAGLDPTREWGKGQKRPWNASLKTLCWKVGESFVKVCNRGSFYGELYMQRKELENDRNERGLFAEQAVRVLEQKRIGKDTTAYAYYSGGKLPPAHIHARAKRYAVKLFLAHWHQVAYRRHFKEEAPKPWIISHGGHVDYISVDQVER